MNADDLRPPNEVIGEKLNEQVLHLRKKAQLLESENRKLSEKIGAQQEIADAIRSTIQALDPLAPVAIRYPKEAQSEGDIEAVIKFSDWHIGEVVAPGEIEGINEFNFSIASEDVAFITKKSIEWAHTNRLAFRIPKLHIFCEGDFISGDIHDELRITNEFPAPVQAVKAGMLLGQSIATLAPFFEEVIVEEVGGDNHSRLQKKPQAKQKASNSFGFVVYAVANQLLEKHKNVRINQGAGMMQIATVADWKFLLMHGDTVKSWMGIPFYGMERQRGKEASRRMALRRKHDDLDFDYISCGHWHVPSIVSENILINGSLSGMSEFDHSCGRFAPPSQVSFLVHPKFGMFNWVAWKPRS